MDESDGGVSLKIWHPPSTCHFFCFWKRVRVERRSREWEGCGWKWWTVTLTAVLLKLPQENRLLDNHNVVRFPRFSWGNVITVISDGLPPSPSFGRKFSVGFLLKPAFKTSTRSRHEAWLIGSYVENYRSQSNPYGYPKHTPQHKLITEFPFQRTILIILLIVLWGRWLSSQEKSYWSLQHGKWIL